MKKLKFHQFNLNVLLPIFATTFLFFCTYYSDAYSAESRKPWVLQGDKVENPSGYAVGKFSVIVEIGELRACQNGRPGKGCKKAITIYFGDELFVIDSLPDSGDSPNRHFRVLIPKTALSSPGVKESTDGSEFLFVDSKSVSPVAGAADQFGDKYLEPLEKYRPDIVRAFLDIFPFARDKYHILANRLLCMRVDHPVSKLPASDQKICADLKANLDKSSPAGVDSKILNSVVSGKPNRIPELVDQTQSIINEKISQTQSALEAAERTLNEKNSEIHEIKRDKKRLEDMNLGLKSKISEAEEKWRTEVRSSESSRGRIESLEGKLASKERELEEVSESLKKMKELYSAPEQELALSNKKTKPRPPPKVVIKTTSNSDDRKPSAPEPVQTEVAPKVSQVPISPPTKSNYSVVSVTDLILWGFLSFSGILVVGALGYFGYTRYLWLVGVLDENLTLKNRVKTREVELSQTQSDLKHEREQMKRSEELEARPEAPRPVREYVREVKGPPPVPIEQIVREYAEALFDSGKLAAFRSGRKVLGFERLGRSGGEGKVSLVPDDSQTIDRSEYWGVPSQDKAMWLIFPGRKQMTSAATLVADDGRVGQREFRGIFDIDNGSKFDCQNPAKASAVPNSNEITIQSLGTVQLPSTTSR